MKKKIQTDKELKRIKKYKQVFLGAISRVLDKYPVFVVDLKHADGVTANGKVVALLSEYRSLDYFALVLFHEWSEVLLNECYGIEWVKDKHHHQVYGKIQPNRS